MNTVLMAGRHRTAARALRAAAAPLAHDGWERRQGQALLQTLSQVATWPPDPDWIEVRGRAQTLEQTLHEFLSGAPAPDRLDAALRAVETLAERIEQGTFAECPASALLPSEPRDWTFLIAETIAAAAIPLIPALRDLGFGIAMLDGAGRYDDTEQPRDPRWTILIADAAWLLTHASPAIPAPVSGAAADGAPFIVAVTDGGDFAIRHGARQAGARLLLEAPVQPVRLLNALTGLAWMPCQPYRILLVDPDRQTLESCATVLRAAGCAVLTSSDPAGAAAVADRFGPETCVLPWSLPDCHGPDLAAALRRNRRFARLPAVYLATPGTAVRSQPDDDGVLPVSMTDPRALVPIVIGRARHYRLSELAHVKRGRTRRELADFREVLDIHAAVSVATPDGTIVEVNAHFCELSGYGRNELIGNTYRLIRSGYHPPSFFAEIWGTVANGDLWQGEIQNRRKDGQPYWVKCTIAPMLDRQGQPLRYLSIHTEIDDQKRLLTQGRHQARLLELLRQAQQRFIATQEIQAPSLLLLDGVIELTASTQGALGEVLHDAAGQSYLKIHAITEAGGSRGACRNGDLECRDPETLLGDALRTGETLLHHDAAGGARPLGLPPGLPPVETLLILPIRYGDTLFGLLVLANRPGGYDRPLVDFLQPLAATYANLIEAVRLRHFQQLVIDDLEAGRNRLSQDGQTLRAFLRDWLGAVQEPLNTILAQTELQLLRDSTLTGDVRGRLEAIARGGSRLTELCGALLARIDEGAGPVASRPEDAPSVPPAADARRRVLIAEDEATNQIMLRMQLELLGCAVELATDGQTALARWRDGRYDLILTDIRMPGMDGLDLTRAIRAAESNSGRRTPIVAITVLDRAEDHAACQAAGLDELLSKPVDLDRLRWLLTDWLPRARSGSGAASAAGHLSGPAEPISAAILDAGFIAHLLGDRRRRSLREFFDLFTRSARADLAGCAGWLRAGDRQAFGAAIDKLAAAGRMAGASRFAALAEALGTRARDAHLEPLAPLLAALEQALDDVEAAIPRFLADASAPNAAAPLAAPPQRVLVVDADALARHQTRLLLNALGVGEILAVETGMMALTEIGQAESGFEVLITELLLPELDGIEFLRQLAAEGFPGRLIICSASDPWVRQAACDLARARGLRLLGSADKPLTRDRLVQLLNGDDPPPGPRGPAPEVLDLTAMEILDGILRDEFKVHFQPKVDARTLHPVGLEALARWQRADRFVPTTQFIAAADAHGLIDPLSRRLFIQALNDGARLIAAGFRLTLAFNLAASWLAEVGLPEFIDETLRSTGFPPELLVLEITETGLIADLNTSLDVLTRLRLKGFKLSIDDFGTGYSSMEQLQRIPFGELKLDRGFVRDSIGKPRAHTILASSIDMARKLNLTTVAEGVETREELDLMRGLGCDLIQGWYIAQAMPLPELLTWLEKQAG